MYNTVFLFDLDNLRIGYRIWDITRICSFLGSFKVIDGEKRELYDKWNINEMKALISGFCDKTQISKVEKADFIKLIGIHTIMGFIAEYDIDDSFDRTFKLYNNDINNELKKLIKLLNKLNKLNILK